MQDERMSQLEAFASIDERVYEGTQERPRRQRLLVKTSHPEALVALRSVVEELGDLTADGFPTDASVTEIERGIAVYVDDRGEPQIPRHFIEARIQLLARALGQRGITGVDVTVPNAFDDFSASSGLFLRQADAHEIFDSVAAESALRAMRALLPEATTVVVCPDPTISPQVHEWFARHSSTDDVAVARGMEFDPRLPLHKLREALEQPSLPVSADDLLYVFAYDERHALALYVRGAGLLASKTLDHDELLASLEAG